MASNVTCGHSPGGVTVASSAKLKVQGSAVLVKDSINGKPVGLCGTVPASDASGPTAKPCLTVSSVDDGEASKLTAGGAPVMLPSLAGKTDGMVGKTTPQTALAGTAGQNKLTAI